MIEFSTASFHKMIKCESWGCITTLTVFCTILHNRCSHEAMQIKQFNFCRYSMMHDNKTLAIKYFMFDGTEKMLAMLWFGECSYFFHSYLTFQHELNDNFQLIFINSWYLWNKKNRKIFIPRICSNLQKFWASPEFSENQRIQKNFG